MLQDFQGILHAPPRDFSKQGVIRGLHIEQEQIGGVHGLPAGEKGDAPPEVSMAVCRPCSRQPSRMEAAKSGCISGSPPTG